jgi:hypothetical protein
MELIAQGTDPLLMLPIPGAMAQGLPAMSKRLKAPPHPDFKFIRGHRGRDVIRIKLPSGGVGFIATTIPGEVLALFAKSLARKIAKGRRLARALGHATTAVDPGGDSEE